jgi:hypothetical protein
MKVSVHPQPPKAGELHGKIYNLYRVEQVTDSIDPMPGDMLTKDTVDGYCHNGGWKVTLVRP